MAYISFQPSDYFNTKLYTGDGNTPRSLTGVGFRPDWIWTKERSSTSSHNSTDVVRGANVSMNQNSTGEQGTETQSIISFDTDGYTVGSGGGVNQSSQTYVSWNWLAGGSQGSSNTDGTINTTYTSVNTTSGFSICQYTGTGANATVGHGLGVAPKMVIVKRTNTTGGWTVYHSSVGNTKYLYLNSSVGEDTASSIWNNTSPTSSVFTVGTDGEVNASGSTYIAYCFAEKKGFSKFGSYTGNGNADGSFIYTGFKPAFVLGKNATVAGQHWFMNDNKRGINGGSNWLKADGSDAELTNLVNCDLLSNGFKLRNNNDIFNDSGETFIYLAFAAAPLVGSNNVPATAR